MDSGRHAAANLEFGAWFDLVIGGAFNMGVAGVTDKAEGAGTKYAEMTNAGMQELFNRDVTSEAVSNKFLAKAMELQAIIKIMEKE